MIEKSKSREHYLKKNVFQKYEENPFIEKAVSVIKENSIQKRQYMNGNRGVQQIVTNVDTGEIVGQSVFAKIVEVDEDRFAKIYLAELGLLWDMNKAALKVFSYILANLKINSDEFFMKTDEAMKYTGYKSVSQLNIGVSKLLELGIIAKSKYENLFFINPMFVFNGNRVTFAKTYVKKKKEFNNPNQLNLLDSLHDKQHSLLK